MFTPKLFQRFRLPLTEALIVVVSVLTISVLTAGLIVHVNKLPNLADKLPAGRTQAYFVMKTEDYNQSRPQFNELLEGNVAVDLMRQDWFKDIFGVAWVDRTPVYFFKTNDEEQALAYAQTQFPDCTDYCVTSEGPYLVLSTSQDALDAIGTRPTLTNTDGFHNARGRLPFLGDAFAYVDLQAGGQFLVDLLGELGYSEPEFLHTLLDIAPSYAFSIDMRPDEWYVESFLAIDKEALGGQGLFRHQLAYRGELLRWSPQLHDHEWGGHDLAAQLTRMQELFEGQAFEGITRALLNRWLGAIELAELYPLLEDEYYLSWTPNEDFLFMLQLDSDDTGLAVQLKDQFFMNYEVTETYTLANGETQADFTSLRGEARHHQDQAYYHFYHEDAGIVNLAILDGFLLLTQREETLHATIDKIQSGQARDISEWEDLLRGIDEMSHIQVTFGQEMSIMSTQKIFDDGIFSRSLIHVQ